MDFKERVKQGPVLFDGAVGTYLEELGVSKKDGIERANITAADSVRRVHEEYIEAGACAVLSNTFAANRIKYDEDEAARLIEAGWSIAKEAAQDRAFVFASIGPVKGEPEEGAREYRWIADRFLSLGAENFMFETLSSPQAVCDAAAYIREKCPNAYIIACFSLGDGGFTAEGVFAQDILRVLGSDPNIDAGGFNCGIGAAHMLETVKGLDLSALSGKPFCAVPNSGYPVIVNRRTVYEGDCDYFAALVKELVINGADIVGGCCGTKPEYIRGIKEKLSEISAGEIKAREAAEESARAAAGKTAARETAGAAAEESAREAAAPASLFWEKLTSGEKPLAVELDPPKDADLTKFLRGVSDLKEGKVDIITIADCPIARARMDSSILACKVRREYGIEAIPHLTCRDRNLNATQALMLGLYAEGIRNMLLVTGDPVPAEVKDEIKTVYQFNSRKLALFASSLNGSVFREPVHLFGALNVNARNFDIQLKLAKQKESNGMVGFFTQPVLTEEAFENIKRAKDELKGYILGGIIPVVSERNARFMNSEISGINVDERVVSLYEGLEREEAEDLAVRISVKIADVLSPYVDGFYLMTPFQRTGLIRRILDGMR